MFYSMVDKCVMTEWHKYSIFWQQASFQYFDNKQVMWKYTLFLSTLPTRQDKFTSLSADDSVFQGGSKFCPLMQMAKFYFLHMEC